MPAQLLAAITPPFATLIRKIQALLLTTLQCNDLSYETQTLERPSRIRLSSGYKIYKHSKTRIRIKLLKPTFLVLSSNPLLKAHATFDK